MDEIKIQNIHSTSKGNQISQSLQENSVNQLNVEHKISVHIWQNHHLLGFAWLVIVRYEALKMITKVITYMLYENPTYYTSFQTIYH